MKKLLLALSVIAIMAATLAGVYFMAFKPSDVFKIHFVNYRGKTDVDEGFEIALKNKNIRTEIVYHNAKRDPSNLPAILDKIHADSKTDLVITWGTTTTLGIFGTLSEPTKLAVPGAFVLVTDPVASEIVAASDAPGRAITGVVHVAPISNQLQAMMAYKPTQKIGVVYTPSEVNSLLAVSRLTQEAAIRGIKVIAIPFDIIDNKPIASNAFAAMQKLDEEKVDWLYLPPDSFLGTMSKDLIIPLSIFFKIPTFASTEQLMQTGATFGLVCTYFSLGELLADTTKQILVDKKSPRDIPVSTVERFRHQMNKDAAKYFGITVTPEMYKSIDKL